MTKNVDVIVNGKVVVRDFDKDIAYDKVGDILCAVLGIDIVDTSKLAKYFPIGVNNVIGKNHVLIVPSTASDDDVFDRLIPLNDMGLIF